MLSLESTGKSRLVGYVAVGVSPEQEQSQVQRVNYFALGIGCITVLFTLPAAYFLVHRLFLPIRQLVGATNRIAAGDLDTAVAIDRADAIGDLARSFNAMIQTVKRQQQDLLDINDGLEQKVIQRTAQLEMANQRLSNEIAEKEDFLRAVSHDLNAPLRNISGMAAMLLMKHRDRFDDEIIHRLQRIQKNVDVETDLISELLELSRIKTRREKMEMIETSALISEIEESLQDLAGILREHLHQHILIEIDGADRRFQRLKAIFAASRSRSSSIRRCRSCTASDPGFASFSRT